RMTVERNLNFKIADINLRVARDGVSAEWGIFDPLFTATLEARDVKSQGSIFTTMVGGAGQGLAGARQAAAMGAPFVEMPAADVRRQDGDTAAEIAELRARLQAIEDALGAGFATDYRSTVRWRTRQASSQVTQQLPTGGALGLGYSVGRDYMQPPFVNINPAYSQTAQLWMIHPLPFFRDWGPLVTMAGIRLAEKTEATQRWEMRQQLINKIAATMSGYWDLVFVIYNAEVQRLALESGRNLLRINEIRLRTGVGTEIDVWEAKAGVAIRENALIRASQAIGLAQDNMARLTRVTTLTTTRTEATDWSVRMIPRDAPTWREFAVDEQKFTAEALEKRPDIRQAKLARERAEIRRKVARNQRMPSLQAFGSYGITGLGPNTGRAGHSLGTFDYDNWSLGIDLSFPIPNTRARAMARQADKLVEGSDLLISQIEDVATFEVRKGIRDLQTARQSIGVGQVQVRAEQEKLRGEMKRFDVGMATSQDVLDYQDRLAMGQSNLIGSIVAYNKAIVDLERARGTLLQSLRIAFDEKDRISSLEPTETGR
ncbi:TolC family protein, partial [Candidatus Sumerlaeota bacterium]|nr:TolC family protein [Candidatus Sumerlaeota bacterium]